MDLVVIEVIRRKWAQAQMITSPATDLSQVWARDHFKCANEVL